MEGIKMEQKSIPIESQRDMKKALNFVNTNNLVAYSGFYKDLKIICTFKLKNKMVCVNYLFNGKFLYELLIKF